MPDLPVMYNYINAANSQVSPSTVHSSNNYLAAYYRRYLLQRAMSVYKWKFPENWNHDYFKYVLYCWGYIAIVNTREFGVIPQQCGLRGFNVFYAPTHAIITNPKISGILEPQIDKECTVIKLQPDYGGILDMVYYYGDQLALYAEAASMNVQNSKLGYIVGARTKTMAEAIKKAYDSIMQGEGVAVYDKNADPSKNTPLFETFVQNLKNTFIASDILESMRKVENEFATKIGLNNTNTDKKERMLVDEVNANNEEIKSLPELWLETLKRECEKTRDLFGITDFDVEWRYKDNEQGSNNVPNGFIPVG